MSWRTTSCAHAPGGCSGHALFETRLGTCGIAWGPGGIVAVQLPEGDPQATRERLLRGLGPRGDPAAPAPELVRAAIAGIQALLAGQPRNLQEIPLDMSRISPFHQRVYAVTRMIAPGQTLTYGEVAVLVGSKNLFKVFLELHKRLAGMGC